MALANTHIRIIATCLLLSVSMLLLSQKRDEFISTRYNGPNAFPVPDMLDGRVSPTMKIELAGDYYHGFSSDRTADLFARAYIPLFTRRVNLTVWMPVMEWYSTPVKRLQECQLQDTASISGHGMGDVYLSTDIQVLYARRWWPDITVRAAIKTASGGQWRQARHYDDPGYFFDAAIGKSLYISADGKPSAERLSDNDWEIRLAASAGFLCWQTTTANQNDAVQYGVQLLVRQKYVSLRTTFNGYSGWRKNGDKPMVVKAELRGYAKGFEPFAVYQYGIQDFPFHLLRIGLAYNIDILKKRSHRTTSPQ
ncbi:MAG: hypothetical protein IJS00_00315 [Paludibacteraceae bacterium]|nr:hypothetical protein [Paludibacteraceae bacterium]